MNENESSCGYLSVEERFSMRILARYLLAVGGDIWAGTCASTGGPIVSPKYLKRGRLRSNKIGCGKLFINIGNALEKTGKHWSKLNQLETLSDTLWIAIDASN